MNDQLARVIDLLLPMNAAPGDAVGAMAAPPPGARPALDKRSARAIALAPLSLHTDTDTNAETDTHTVTGAIFPYHFVRLRFRC